MENLRPLPALREVRHRRRALRRPTEPKKPSASVSPQPGQSVKLVTETASSQLTFRAAGTRFGEGARTSGNFSLSSGHARRYPLLDVRTKKEQCSLYVLQ